MVDAKHKPDFESVEGILREWIHLNEQTLLNILTDLHKENLSPAMLKGLDISLGFMNSRKVEAQKAIEKLNYPFRNKEFKYLDMTLDVKADSMHARIDGDKISIRLWDNIKVNTGEIIVNYYQNKE